ncbi:DUF1987 domain-containing protein [Marinoscillum sp.]|uniref:DUF1987 domain-containing protein n=1 Tax=Marinoscillum sp. TaxID=2024838 RepID=UPI003BAC919A
MLFIRKTHLTPEIKFDPRKGRLEITGMSSPDNSMAVYQPLLKILNAIKATRGGIKADFKLSMFNTSSAKCIFDILKRLKALEDQGLRIVINWHYEEEDDDMLECGEDFQDLLDAQFNFIESYTSFQQKVAQAS